MESIKGNTSTNILAELRLFNRYGIIDAVLNPSLVDVQHPQSEMIYLYNYIHLFLIWKINRELCTRLQNLFVSVLDLHVSISNDFVFS